MRTGLRCVMLAAAVVWSGLASAQPAQRHPDVLSVQVKSAGGDRFDFDATVSSPYDSPQRYADAFQVRSQDGRVFGERILWHDHASEQPFTRDLYGVMIPAPVRDVVVQARDKQYGYGGRSVTLRLPGR